MKHSILLIFIAALTSLSTQACERPRPPTPVPNPSTDQMAASIQEVQAYIEAGMGYVDCMEKKGESTKLVKEMNTTIDKHNQRIRIYHERLRTGQQQEIDKNQ